MNRTVHNAVKDNNLFHKKWQLTGLRDDIV